MPCPVKQDGSTSDLPEQIKAVMLTVAKEEEETLSDRIDINRFSPHTELLHVTARILAGTSLILNIDFQIQQEI